MIREIFKPLLVLLLFASTIFVACNEDITNSFIDEETLDTFVDQSLFELQNEGNIGRLGCYELVFPITINFSDETTSTVNDYEELAAAIQTWKENNPDATERPAFEFPIEVLSEDGELTSVTNGEELKALKRACRADKFNDRDPRGHRKNCKPCFDMVFPITIQFPDATTAEVSSRAELKTTLRAWKAANPDATERPTIAFPIDVEFEDGSITTVNSSAELEELKQACRDEERPEWEPCFKVVFPVTILFPDGTTAEAANREEKRALYREWKAANPDATERPEITFPIHVELEDETVVTINTEEELEELKESCND